MTTWMCRLVILTAFSGAMALPAVAQDVCDGVSEVGNSTLKSVEVVSGLSGRPLYVTAPPGDTERIFVLEQDGLIWFHRRGDDPSVKTLFMDISGRVWTAGFDNEAGLLGLAFDPDYANNGFFYVNYFAGGGFFSCNTDCRTVVSRFSVDAGDPDAGDPTSETILMEFPQPQNNHNGGQVFFGPLEQQSPPKAYLFIATGDGGGAEDDDAGHGVCGNAQPLDTLLGKVLRIDVSGIDPAGTAPDTTCMAGFTAAGYTVPTGNAFVDGAGGNCDEVWAHGLRNPWRNAFDSETGDFYTADVGQGCWEEINFVAAAGLGGENYGWRQMEGDHCFNHNNAAQCDPASAPDCSPPCNDPGLVVPVVELSHSDPEAPCSITGGEVYRGCRMPLQRGKYFYGDYCAGIVRSFQGVDGAGNPLNEQDWTAQLDPGGLLGNGLTSFGRDAQGEVYIVDRSGSVLLLSPPFPELEVSGAGAVPFRLNRSGNWSWEDLELASRHPVDYYEVYRGVPNGTFDCIHSTCEASWVTGDPADPAPGELFAYIVVAISPASEGAERSSTGDPERTLGTACAHPAPPECP